jgi:hypothetical protein
MKMGMMKLAPIAAATMMLAACGGEKPAPVEEAPAKLAAGLYELSSEVTLLESTDKTTPSTKLAKGATSVIKACVTAEGMPDPALLGEEGDKCEIKNSYIRNGRMSAQMSCTREGHSGYVMPAMMGSYSADGFEGEVTTLTYFVENGDYRLTRKISAKRVGDCPAEAPKAS